jgi:hypothetical protein
MALHLSRPRTKKPAQQAVGLDGLKVSVATAATSRVAFSGISPHFRPRWHRLSATRWREEMADRFRVWNEVTAIMVARTAE